MITVSQTHHVCLGPPEVKFVGRRAKESLVKIISIRSIVVKRSGVSPDASNVRLDNYMKLMNIYHRSAGHLYFLIMQDKTNKPLTCS